MSAGHGKILHPEARSKSRGRPARGRAAVFTFCGATKICGLREVLSIAFFLPSDPAENRRRPTFLREEGKMIKASSTQGLCSLAAGLVFGSLVWGLPPQAGHGLSDYKNLTERPQQSLKFFNLAHPPRLTQRTARSPPPGETAAMCSPAERAAAVMGQIKTEHRAPHISRTCFRKGRVN